HPSSRAGAKVDIIKLLNNVFCLVIVDEAYMDFWGESVLDRVTEFDNLIVLRTCSKNMGLAALRLGFAVASPSITTALKAVKSPYNTSTLDQAAAYAALKNKPLITEYTAEIVRSRKALQEALAELSGDFRQIERVYDSVTNFVFFKSSKSAEICRELEKNSIAVRKVGGYIRVTAGTEEENEIFLSALKEILAGME
ncbi:MAG: aminotransferase class I/II-fold pyridoxal phosphate-dependent enzyme, partial [Oscillospiraceae bacterium]|nr:aminotransferase class I/II-fold pyridoxal phosphate-dependent enzyme [Oscillospiraceae bacterium]